MKINILIPYKEKFDKYKASSVSITIKNNLFHTNFLNNIKIYGQNVENPLFKDNFIGVQYTILSLKSKNNFLADHMLSLIKNSKENKQIIEIHNRPYLINKVCNETNFPTSLFLHNDPQTMKGSKSIKDRKNILNKCAAVFCVSQYIKNQFLTGISSDNKKVHVLYNGVEKNLKKFPNKKNEILFVGRLVPEKGSSLYVNIAKSIAPNHPDWNFGLIGSVRLGENKNDNAYSNDLISTFNSIGPQAKFYGFKDHDFVGKKMKTASIIVIPSLWEEPFGLVAAEAMSNGIAIVASNVGGIPEIVKNNGILIKNINAKKIENAVIDLIENSEKREILQRNAWKNFRFTSLDSSKRLDKFRKTIIHEHY